MPLNPSQHHALQQLVNAASPEQVAAVMPPQLLATLTPPSTGQRIHRGVPYEETPVHEPIPWLPVDKNIAYSLNDRVVNVLNQTANTEQTTNLGFDTPSVVYAISAAARLTAGTISAAYQSSLDLFKIQFELSNGRKWQTTTALGSTICGTAERPRMLGRPAWRFSTGAVLLVKITPLVANLDIDLVLYTIETPGAV